MSDTVKKTLLKRKKKGPAMAEENWKPLNWENTAIMTWDSWQHVMPYLTLKDIHALSQTTPMFQTFVDLYFGSGKGVIHGALPEQPPSADDMMFYKFIGRSATRLTIANILDCDLAPILSCFPHLRELTLRKLRIYNHKEIKGFPVKLRKLTIESCHADSEFLEEWATALSPSLDTLLLSDVDWKLAHTLGGNVKNLRFEGFPMTLEAANKNLETLTLKGSNFPAILNFPKLKKLNIESDSPIMGLKLDCPSLEQFSLDLPKTSVFLNDVLSELERTGSTETLTTLNMNRCPPEIGLLDRFVNLKHLTISDPIEDTSNWSLIKQLSIRLPLKTFNCRFCPAPVEVLPDEVLIRIIGYLDTEDFIALTHVNRRLRGIVFDHIFATAEIVLSDGAMKRYPLEKCKEIYEAVGQRARKLFVKCEGAVRIFDHMDFPHLKSLRIWGSHIEGLKGIPAGLEKLEIKAKIDARMLLNQSAPTLQFLKLHSDYCLYNLLPQMTNLRQISACLTPSCLETILKSNPNLEHLDVIVRREQGLFSYQTLAMDLFLETLRCVPLLKTLVIDTRMWDGLITTPTVTAKDPILPKLKKLTILHHDSTQRNCIVQLLQTVCPTELKELSLENPFDEIILFRGLESLKISGDLDIKTIMEIVKALPNLVELTGHKTISFEGTLELVAHLARIQRPLTFNGVKIAVRPL